MGDSLRKILWGDASCESTCSSQQIYIPQVKSELIPRVNQHFENLDEVSQFYKVYSREGGFGTRKGSSKKSRDGEIIRKEFFCCKQGLRLEKSVDMCTQSTSDKSKQSLSENDSVEQAKTRRHNITRENCLAKMCVVKDKARNKGFRVSQFIEGHSHPLLSPKKVHLHRSHRQVTDLHRSLTEHLSAANVPTCQQMSLLELQYGGIENVGCSQKDLYNEIRDKRKLVSGRDAEILHEHFENEKLKNPNFTFAFQTDDEGRLRHCFWADEISRNAYSYFGDVVVFYTTYNTNKYFLIFAPIVGVNHHGQTTLFGCAFLSDETTESFEWLLNEWMKVMPSGPPKMIITDQDPAMTNAIANVLPNTCHKFCIWHILSKFAEKIGWHSYKNHYDAFSDCIWNSRTPDEFEVSWEAVLTEAKLSTHEWLMSLYDMRARWVPIYSKGIFSAGMTSSQRAESDHAFFKRYVSKDNSLFEFVTHFERALGHIRHKELELDAKDVNEKPVLKTTWLMEKKMGEVYTLNMFYKFQEQLFQANAYKGTMTGEDEHQYFWDFQRVELEGSRSRVLVVDKPSGHVLCSCKMLESEGIPCRHMLSYLTRLYVTELPDHYIFRRWTRTEFCGRVMDELGLGTGQVFDTSLLGKRSSLFRLASNAIDEALSNEDDTEILIQALESTRKIIADRKCSHVGSKVSASQLPTRPVVGQSVLKEPLPVRAKGCGKRLKGGKELAVEKAAKKGRFCRCCKKHGQNHDSRNCPTKAMLVDEEESDDDVNIDEVESDEDDDDDVNVDEVEGD